MEIIYTQRASEDRAYWEEHNPNIVTKIDELLKAISINPFKGIGKPEPLRFKKSGYWSRRINREHRLVYKIHEKTIYVAQCRYHY